MKSWPTKQLNELLLALETGSRPKGGVGEILDGIPSVSGEHINSDGGFYWHSPRYITKHFYTRMNRGHIQCGDILVVKDGATTGKIAMVRENFPFREAAINEHVFLLRTDKSKALPEYVGYFLLGRTGQQQILSNFRGAAIGGIAQDFVRKVHIPLPDVSEQKRIVKLLDEADELRKMRAQADRRTADLIPAIFHEMFGDPMDNARNWPLCPVSSFVEELYGGRSVKPAGADEADGRFRILKVSAVTWGEFQPEESKPVPAEYEPLKTHFVAAGDLLFSRANTTELVGATSYVFDTPPNLLLPDKLWRFVWKQPRLVEPLFVWWLFQARSIRRELGQRATGTGGSMKNISKPKVLSLKVPLPALPLQKKFAQQASEIRELEVIQSASRRRLDELFQSMLYRAFNGEL